MFAPQRKKLWVYENKDVKHMEELVARKNPTTVLKDPEDIDDLPI